MARDLSSRCRRRDRNRGSTGRRRTAEISIVTINGNFWTTHAEWMAQVGPRHLVLGQEHRLEAGRCEEEAGNLERQGWRCGFSPAKRNALKAKTDSSLATSAGTFVAAFKHKGLEWVWPARAWQSKELEDHGRLAMAWVPIMGGLTVFSAYLYHTEEWTDRNEKLLEATSREIRRCPGLWILAGDFNMEPETFGQYATPARLPGVLVNPAAPTFRHGASVRCFDYFVVPPRSPASVAITHRWLCARTSLPGLRAVGEHGRTMDTAHAKHRARNPGRMRCLGRQAASSHGQRGRTSMGDQESCTCEVSQQVQDGQEHMMVESVEQQSARALADGSPAHQTTTPAPTAGAD